MFGRRFAQKVRAIVISSSVAVVLSSIPSAANPWDIKGLWNIHAYRESSTMMDVSSTDLKWVSAPDDQTKNGLAFKFLSLYASCLNNTEVYYTITSQIGSGNSADPKLWYGLDDGSMSYLSDDERGGRDFVAVVHFAPGSWTMVQLYLTHYSSSDLAQYGFYFNASSANPQMNGCYYLEVSTNGTKQMVWHP